jgi:hypothetical protein
VAAREALFGRAWLPTLPGEVDVRCLVMTGPLEFCESAAYRPPLRMPHARVIRKCPAADNTAARGSPLLEAGSRPRIGAILRRVISEPGIPQKQNAQLTSTRRQRVAISEQPGNRPSPASP